MSSPSQAARRNGSFKKPSKPNAAPSIHRQQPSQPFHHPIFPTSFETFLLSIYPATLLLGSIFSLLNPHSRAAPYSPVLQSHPPNAAPSYFAQKSNFFNTYFVKVGWFWTTLAFFVFWAVHPFMNPRFGVLRGPSDSDEEREKVEGFTLTPRRLQAALRWGLTTLWWAAVTQWFFGPGLIDRGFRLTGGVCAMASKYESQGRIGTSGASMDEAKELLTSAACKLAGGQWSGGHDISGHVFLLTLGSAFLGMEILPVVMRLKGLIEERRVTQSDGSIQRARGESFGQRDHEMAMDIEGKSRWGLGVPFSVAGLSWWMLLMTATYFHTWFEKFTGLLVALMGISLVYFLPRVVPAFRDVVGMPGI